MALLTSHSSSHRETRANFSKLVDSAEKTHERFEVTRNGRRVAVVMSAEDYDSLVETVDILSDPEEVEAVRQGLAAIEAGEVSKLDEVRAEMIERSHRRRDARRK